MATATVKRRNNGFSSTVPQSTMRIKVNKDYSDIKAIAKKKGRDPKAVAEDILRMSTDELTKYIQSKGEVPAKTWEGKSLQAALLRMEDVSVLSRSMNMTEDQALAHIEEAESDAVQNNTAAKAAILTPSTQAALCFVIQHVLSEMKAKAGVTGVSNSLDKLRAVLPLKNHNVSVSSLANSFDGSDSTDDTTDFGDPLSPVSVTTGVQPIGVSGGDITAVAPTTSDVTAGGSSSDGSSSGSIWSNIGSLASVASSIGSTITSTANSLGNTINNVGGQVGANAISTYLSENWMYLVAGIIGIAIIIILFTRAAQR